MTKFYAQFCRMFCLFVLALVGMTAYAQEEENTPEESEAIRCYTGYYKADGKRDLLKISGALYVQVAKKTEQGYYITIPVQGWEDVYFVDIVTPDLPQVPVYYDIDENNDLLINGQVVGFIIDPTSEEAVRYAVNMNVKLQDLINRAETIDLTDKDEADVAAFTEALNAAKNADPFVDDFAIFYNELEVAMQPLGKGQEPFTAYVGMYDANGKPYKLVKVGDQVSQFAFKPTNKGYYITFLINSWEDQFFLNLDGVAPGVVNAPVHYQLDGNKLVNNGAVVGFWLDAMDDRTNMYMANLEVDLAAVIKEATEYDTTGNSQELIDALNDAVQAAQEADPFYYDYYELANNITKALRKLQRETGITTLEVAPAYSTIYGIDGRRNSRTNGLMISNGRKLVK